MKLTKIRKVIHKRYIPEYYPTSIAPWFNIMGRNIFMGEPFGKGLIKHGSRYVDGRHGYPNLGEGLRFSLRPIRTRYVEHASILKWATLFMHREGE